MALQGTIDSFPLVDVLKLLSTSNKTGRLDLVGDRGRGVLWVVDGCLVAATVQGVECSGAADAVWELLRFSDGSFEFVADDAPATEAFSADVGDAVEAAAAMLDQWERVTERVPSLEHLVSLAPSPPGDDVRLSSDDWAVVVAAGPSPSVAEVLQYLELAEFVGCSRLAELVDRGLIVLVETAQSDPVPAQPDVAQPDVAQPDVAQPDVAQPDVAQPDVAQSEVAQPAAAPVVAEPSPVLDPDLPLAAQYAQEPAAQPVAQEPAAQHVTAPSPPATVETQTPGTVDGTASQAFPEHFPIDDLLGEEQPAAWQQANGDQGAPVSPDPHATVPTQPVGEPAAPHAADPFATNNVSPEQASDASDDVLAQIGRLSPKAAEAIAEALGDGEPAPR